MKKLWGALLLLAVVLVCSLVLTTRTEAVVAHDSSEDYGYKIFANNKVAITSYYGAGGDVTIPSTLDGHTVISIGKEAFRYAKVTAVTIPASVEKIEEYAFYNCTNLTSVTFADSWSIYVYDYAFGNCTSLTTLTTASRRNRFERYAFDNCKALRDVYVDSVENLLNSEYEYSGNYYGSVYVNSYNLHILDGNGKEITDLVLDDSVTEIPDYAFSNCNSLTSVTIPDSVTSIGLCAFSSCDNLSFVAIGNGVTTINHDAFYNCDALTSVTIPDSVTSIRESVFYNCDNLTSVTIGDGAWLIDENAFAECKNLTTVTMGASVNEIRTDAFKNCANLKNVYIKDIYAWWEVEFRNEYANPLRYGKMRILDDNGKVVTELLIDDSVTIIPVKAFYNCDALTSVTIPDSVTNIRDCAFSQCDNLTTVTIGNGVKTIGSEAFSYCDSLTSVTIPDSVTTIGEKAFRGCVSLSTLHIGNGVKTIGEYAFSSCTSLTSVTIPDSVTSIANDVFFSCDNLSSATIGNGITTISSGLFSCTSLTSVTIPDSVTTICNAFGNTCLTDVYYGGSPEQWRDISFDYGTDELLKAKIHYKVGHPHSYTQKVNRPSCTVKGYTTYTCFCGDSYKSDYVNALGHSYSYNQNGRCIRCNRKPAAAKITTQPKNAVVANGKTATVTIKATGTGLKYTWYYAKKGVMTYTKTNVTSATYSVKMSSSIDGGKVYCVVSDICGNRIKSNVVTLYKGTPVKITTQPKSMTVANGKTGKLTIKASGSSLKYQWYIKYKGASSFTKVGSSSKTYSFKMASKLDGAQVYCVVKDKYGIEVKSSVVTIKMPVQPKITTQPKSTKAFSGKTVKFTVKASGEGLKYQWYYAKKGSNSFKKLSAKSATYSVKVSSSVDGRKYYCLVTDQYGQTVKTSTVTLTMQRAAKILTQPKNVSVKNGKAAKVTIKAEGDGLKYTWYYLLAGETKYRKATFTGNTFSVTMSAKYKNTKVYCVIADQYGNTVKSKTVTLKMK